MVGLGCLLLSACASLPEAAPRPLLAPDAGAEVSGSLAPGETAVFALELPVGLYFEVFLDQPEARAQIYLLTPGTAPDAAAPTARPRARTPGAGRELAGEDRTAGSLAPGQTSPPSVIRRASSAWSSSSSGRTPFSSATSRTVRPSA